MAMVEIPRPLSGIRYPVFSMRQSFSGRSEIMEDVRVSLETTPSPGLKEDVMFVALGKEAKESETILMWALKNLEGKRICIIHVHQPVQKIPTPFGTKFSINQLEEHQVKAYHESERQEMHKILDKYIRTCERAGAQAEKLCEEMDSIETGLVKLITENEIKWLVMGTTSFSRRMKEPRSKKAIFVCLQAPISCHIWFICKGNLIHTRESNLGGACIEAVSPSFQRNPDTQTVQSSRSHSIGGGEMVQTKSRLSPLSHRRFKSDNLAMQLLASTNGSGRVSPLSLNQEGNNDLDCLSKRSPSVASCISTCSFSELNENLGAVPSLVIEQSETCFESPVVQQSDGSDCQSSVASTTIAEAAETMCAEELRRRKEIEKALARGVEEIQNMKRQLDEISEELTIVLEQNSLLERKITDSDKIVEELKQKMYSAVELLQKYKKERDELQVECDNALSVAEELRKKQAEEPSSSSVSQLFSEFSFLEIEEATRKFTEDLKVGEGGYGSIYRGSLRYIQVAIKVLHPGSLQGPLEFQQEVNILSTLRHPNLVTLIGACSEAYALIYEYLPNGSLEDRLTCKDNSTPLSWQIRIRIAAELCSALIFLHSCRPQGIVNGNLKSANILLDANFTSKLSDFGICRLPSKNEDSKINTTRCRRTDPKSTPMYIDPEFLAIGELTSKSDVYAYGIILLRLLTGRSALRISREVQYALDKGNLIDLLDPTAGDWPFVQAKQLAHLALRCADMNGRNRPSLDSEVWRVLESMRVSCGVSPSRFGSEERVPSYFVCPIFQEVMQDPVVAADGFTYEAEAIKGWLDSGHETSPMTNLKLAHQNLVPNRALRSAIQESFQQR